MYILDNILDTWNVAYFFDIYIRVAKNNRFALMFLSCVYSMYNISSRYVDLIFIQMAEQKLISYQLYSHL